MQPLQTICDPAAVSLDYMPNINGWSKVVPTSEKNNGQRS